VFLLLRGMLGKMNLETGGMGNARKLATFIGTSVDKLQQYLKGEYSLEDYLRLPLLDTGESEESERTDPVDQVIT
jgi:hypothetical protein